MASAPLLIESLDFGQLYALVEERDWQRAAGVLIDSDETLIGYFLDEAKVAAVHGAAFGLSPAFRISYATSDEVLKKACTRIQEACAALK